MSSSSYGENIRIAIFGQSHAPAIGVTIEGLPAGFTIDRTVLQAFLDRRAPGRDETSTARREAAREVSAAGHVLKAAKAHLRGPVGVAGTRHRAQLLVILRARV